MGDFFSGLWNGLINVGNTVLNTVMYLLPDSPFSDIEIPAEVKKILGYVNYFVPIRAMLIIGASWLSAISIYYLYQVILRKVNAIK